MRGTDWRKEEKVRKRNVKGHEQVQLANCFPKGLGYAGFIGEGGLGVGAGWSILAAPIAAQTTGAFGEITNMGHWESTRYG